eukprot:798143-Pelagomonas_calceolata.AAC.2
MAFWVNISSRMRNQHTSHPYKTTFPDGEKGVSTSFTMSIPAIPGPLYSTNCCYASRAGLAHLL